MKSRGRVIGAVLALLWLPPLVALLEAVVFHVRNANDGSIVSSGEVREYLLHVPRSYDPARPTPLVINLHGAAGWPAQQRDISGWNRLADEHGFIAVYPSGLGGRGSRVWRLGREAALARDVRFVADLIDELQQRFNLDPARIYANGLSAGGAMAFALSCALPDRIAAIGSVAAARVLPWSRCGDAPPVPVIAFHGTADPIVPYRGGTTWIGDVAFPDVEEWFAGWARRNRCRTEPVDSTVAADVTRRRYPGCADGADVELFTVHGGGHTWPGGMPLPEWFAGPTSAGVDATGRMWAFFSKHPLRGRARGGGKGRPLDAER